MKILKITARLLLVISHITEQEQNTHQERIKSKFRINEILEKAMNNSNQDARVPTWRTNFTLFINCLVLGKNISVEQVLDVRSILAVGHIFDVFFNFS